MNRFTKDIGSMDELLPYAFFDAVTIFLLMVTMVTLIIIANAYMAIPTAVLLVLLFLVRAYYIHTARDVKRIEAVSKSIQNSNSANYVSSSIQLYVNLCLCSKKSNFHSRCIFCHGSHYNQVLGNSENSHRTI